MKLSRRMLLFVSFVSLVVVQIADARGGGGYRGGGSKGGHRSSGHVSVNSYTKRNGTHVQSHKRTNPNSSKRDNWSSKGNNNPYTGKEGTKEP